MNMYQNIYDAAVKTKETQVWDQERGLCTYIQRNLDCGIINITSRFKHNQQFHDCLYDCFMDWSEFSGNMIFPVKPPEDAKYMDSIGVYFSEEYPNYEGEYGASRMRLLDHIIEWMSVRAANYDMSICGLEAEANE